LLLILGLSSEANSVSEKNGDSDLPASDI
jgi:hypothetical protein